MGRAALAQESLPQATMGCVLDFLAAVALADGDALPGIHEAHSVRSRGRARSALCQLSTSGARRAQPLPRRLVRAQGGGDAP
eukprot:15013045-Alexandrium_andersonii.AAC.1